MGDPKTTRFDDCLPPGCFLSVTPNAVRVDDATFEAAWDRQHAAAAPLHGRRS